MKAKRKSGYNYSLLKRKMIVRVVLSAIVAAVVVYLFREMSRGRLADGIVRLLMRIMSADEMTAEAFYSSHIRNNLNLFMLLAIFGFFIVAIRILLGSFVKYFNEVIAGIDSITHEGQGEIRLSSELEFVERKLNNVKETLEKRAEEARRAERQKNDLVVYLAHDIKTPLTSVIGYLSLLDEAAGLPEEKRSEYTKIALQKANRLETLVNEFFEITQYNLQAVPLDRDRINLCYMMVQITDELFPQLKARESGVRIDIDEAVTVFGDADKLARVFNNILKNAIAYGSRGGTITISAEEGPDKTVVRFQNKGSIPKDKLAFIFDKFYRLNAARSSATGGAGLGLAIARDIVTLHGGRIMAESGDDSTVFTIELPSGPQ